MISFGELRRKSVEWQMELGDVEKAYALDWIVRGIASRPSLGAHLALSGASALALAFLLRAPRVQDADFAVGAGLETGTLEHELGEAAREAAALSGMPFRVHTFRGSEARFEFTGPLGRRSAAQPLIVVRFSARSLRLDPVLRPLIHPFNEEFQATVRAVSLDELAAERIYWYSLKPRARDVLELWLILTQGQEQLDGDRVRALAAEIAREKQTRLAANLDPTYAPLLERSWDRSLSNVRPHPLFERARAEIDRLLEQIL